MKDSFLISTLKTFEPEELAGLHKFVQSPVHNKRADVVRLLEWVMREKRKPNPVYDKRKAFEAVYTESEPFSAGVFNLCMRYLMEQIEEFLAWRQWRSDESQYRLSLMRALRHKKLNGYFERQALKMEREQSRRSERHAGFYLAEYELQTEKFQYQILRRRDWNDNLPQIVEALEHYFTLEYLRWSSVSTSLHQRSGKQPPPLPLVEAATTFAADPRRHEALRLPYYAMQVVNDTDDMAVFERLEAAVSKSVDWFPPSQSRDIYMAAINFCIRQSNRGRREFAIRALNLYRQALQSDILLENGAMPPYTYHNINALAHLAGEGLWAEHFLESAKDQLPEAVREQTYRYNIAICHFRKADYARALEALREIEAGEVYAQLDIRRMLIRAYFELGEWWALESLLQSFKAFLSRRKDLGYHRVSYINLIRYTHQVMKLRLAGKTRRLALAQKIKAEPQLAEKEWLLQKIA